MRLNQPDIETLAIINEQIGKIQNHDKIKRANESLALLALNNVDFENELAFMEFLNNKIRTPLYELYTSEEIVNLDKSTKNALFNALMFISYYWPLSKKCCITNVDLSDKPVSAFLLSGHMVDRIVLAKLWAKDQSYLHPVFKKRVSTREVLVNYPGIDVDTNKFNSISPPDLVERIREEIEIPVGVAILLILSAFAALVLTLALVASIPAAFPFVASGIARAALEIAGVALSLYSAFETLNILTPMYFNWAVESKYQEETSFNDKLKKSMDRIACQKIEVRNNAFFSLFKSTNELRERTAINNPQSTSATPSITSSNDTQSATPSSPSNNWNVVGLHAARKKSSENSSAVSAEIQSEQKVGQKL